MSTDICTSIEQSKKLLSLGIDPNTADMFYDGVKDITTGKYYIPHKSPMIRVGKGWEDKYPKESVGSLFLPAWSLTALLKLLPDIIKVKEECYTFSLIKNVIEYVGHDGSILYSTGGKSFVDAAVKMFELIDNDKNILHYIH